jgi:hypothetical protein
MIKKIKNKRTTMKISELQQYMGLPAQIPDFERYLSAQDHCATGLQRNTDRGHF